jgi:hypothetical protein
MAHRLVVVMVNTMTPGKGYIHPMTMGMKTLAGRRFGHAPAVTRWGAARRGAIVAVLWAVVTFAPGRPSRTCSRS